MDYKLNRAWAEINLDNIAGNVREIRKIIDDKTEIIAAVKADAYGHGVLEVTRTLLSNGVTRLAVSILDEAVQLRKNGINVPILILSYTDPARANEIIDKNVTQTVFSLDLARALSNAAVEMGKEVRIHVKVDTGMTRVGFMPGYSAVKNIIEISKMPGIVIEGLFTHFASADERDKTYTYMQFEKFMSICSELSRAGIHIPLKHVANSAAMIKYPRMHLNMVRPGIVLYGLYPSSDVQSTELDLKPAMTLKANVILVKEVEKNICVSYGRTFKTKCASRIATVPIGYADGYTRLLSNKAHVLVNGEYSPVIGNICMDQCMIDVTEMKNEVKTGDEVVLFGRQKDKEIKVEDVASAIGTINYEVISIIGKRIPRVYIKNGKLSKVLNYLV